MEELVTVNALGACIGLVLSIILIFRKVPPIYSLMLGALVGGLLGGADLVETVNLMISGAQGMMTSVLRILAAGILAGVLIQSGAADSIARHIIQWVGSQRALLALSLATLILTAVGVFVDIAVITVAPIALAVAKEASISKPSILLAMIGGGKAGNMMSPNPNTIAVSDAFQSPLTSIMLAGVIPAIVAIMVTFFLSRSLTQKGSQVEAGDLDDSQEMDQLPNFFLSISGPLVAILLLALRPIADINIDPMIALPLGGIVGALLLGKGNHLIDYAQYGLGKMTGVAIILIGTGTIAGIIQNSTIGDLVISLVEGSGLPIYLLAPLAGIVMSAATASTTSGATVASQVFAPSLLHSGVSGIQGAAMIHTGSTVLDHLPHGSFFHATGGSVNMAFKESLKLIAYESLVGLSLTLTATLLYGLLGFAG